MRSSGLLGRAADGRSGSRRCAARAAEALELSLEELRAPTGAGVTRRPARSGVQQVISQLPASRCVRLLGLTTRSWPRRTGEDPLVPSHILPRDALDSESVTRNWDRRAYEIITWRTLLALWCSPWSRRNTPCKAYLE